MIFLLDTNVLSEAMKPEPAERVAAWMRAQPLRSLFTASLCCAEILAGIAVMPDGRRRRELEGAAAAIFGQDFAGRILPFDEAAAVAYAALLAKRRTKGRPIATADLIVAATAQAQKATIVTRDVGGFTDCGIDIVDPWRATDQGST